MRSDYGRVEHRLDLSRRELLAAAGATALAASLPARALASLPGDELADLSVLGAARRLRRGVCSSRELTEACLARIETRDRGLNAWVRVYREHALADADRSDRRRARARRRHITLGPLDGVPIGVKDIYAIAGLPLTAGSKILAGNVAREDAAAWANLRDSGMVLVGHTQTHEFATGNFTPQSSNPWDRERTPGGSSGGSAIALAARMVPAAIGSDTLGSLRIPAGVCGVTAIKPTLGAVSVKGLIPLASSFDTAGPMGRSAADCAVLLAGMAEGRKPSGRYAVKRKKGSRPLSGVRVGLPSGSFGGVEPTAAIAERVAGTARQLESLGATLVRFAAPRSSADNLSGSGFSFFLTGPGREIDEYHRRYFPARISEYTSDVTFTLTLLRAVNLTGGDPTLTKRTADGLTAAWSAAFRDNRLDVVLQPAAVIETPKHSDAQLATQSIGDPMVVWNYTGFPALVAPAGLSRATGLPVGTQMAALPGNDQTLLRVAVELQAHSGEHYAGPPGLA